jgi:mono/diheme cytochrome c family protein
VVDDSEYREQVEFLGVLQGLVAELPDKPERAELVKGVDELLAAVTAHQDGASVARQARQLGAKLAVAYEVSQAPAITPDPTRGAPLYAQHCSVCHGTTGAGDGPAGVGMTPPPANLRDATRLDRLSLYAIYNTLGLGVEGTDMPSFADQLDDRQRWDLATYIAGFTADPAAAKGEQTFNLADLARQTPTEVLAADGPDAATTFRAQRAQPPAAAAWAAAVARAILPSMLEQAACAPTALAIMSRLMTYRWRPTWRASSWSKALWTTLIQCSAKTTERALMDYRQASAGRSVDTSGGSSAWMQAKGRAGDFC